MPYISGRRQLIASVSYGDGEEVPADVVASLKAGVVNNMLTRGLLEFVQEQAPPPPPPEQEPQPEWIYRGSGWWVHKNGIKTRGPADRPPALTGAG
jgi:hypothetical protein